MKQLRELQRRFQDYLIGGSEDIERDIISTDENVGPDSRGLGVVWYENMVL